MLAIKILGGINPTDVKVYYEGGKPYLDYKGVASTDCRKVEIHIPKMGLNLTNIENVVDVKEENGVITSRVCVTAYVLSDY